jgi:hypothetical protein
VSDTVYPSSSLKGRWEKTSQMLPVQSHTSEAGIQQLQGIDRE